MTPALAKALVFCWLTMWAVTEPSAARVWFTRWKASAVVQMSPPPPTSDQVPLVDRLSWPGGRAPPMSLQLHPAGQTPGGAEAPPNWARLSTAATA